MRAPTVRTNTNIAKVREIVEDSPKKSLRKISSETGIAYASVHAIVRQDLKLFPYKATLLHGLKEEDHPKCVDYCSWFVERETARDFEHGLIFSGEAAFYLSGGVNRQNERFWGEENPPNFWNLNSSHLSSMFGSP